MGIAANKLVAQIASKLRKPRGFVVVPPGDEAAFLAPLPSAGCPASGPRPRPRWRASASALWATCSPAASGSWRPPSAGTGAGCWSGPGARTTSPVETEEEDAKSYSKQETFSADVGDFAEIERVAKRMLDELMPKVRADGAKVRTITVKVRYPDFFPGVPRRSLEARPTSRLLLSARGAPAARRLARPRPLRLVSVRLSGVDAGPAQLEMFAQADERRRKLAGVLDRLNRGGGFRRHPRAPARRLAPRRIG
jgi:DNA polymerase IV